MKRELLLTAFIVGSCLSYAQLPTVGIEILSDSIAQLESNPFLGEDVMGNFIGSDGVKRDQIDLNYRGAYQLKNLMNQYQAPLRNWKVKVPKELSYRERREWNYNYEEHPRQVLTYYTMNKAGVSVPSCRHVLFSVNGVEQGMYVEYEDPDNKDWLKDKFGNNDGDLFKAAYDIPGQPRFFAGMNDLGDTDEDYLGHYNKKTNNKNENEGDYSSLISFIKVINDTPDNQFVEILEQYFETAAFIKYLVIANFISNWDSYPARPKNYWLYQNPDTDKWSFIPWDLDATFQTGTTGLNHMGTSVSIFYQFDGYEEYDLQPQEGTERPLVTRMMKFPQYRNAYVQEYKKALDSYLNKDVLYDVLDSLTSTLNSDNLGSAKSRYDAQTSDVKSFINIKSKNVKQEVDNYKMQIVAAVGDITSSSDLRLQVYPNPSTGTIFLKLPKGRTNIDQLSLIDLVGNTVQIFENAWKNSTAAAESLTIQGLTAGTYILQVRGVDKRYNVKILVY